MDDRHASEPGRARSPLLRWWWPAAVVLLVAVVVRLGVGVVDLARGHLRTGAEPGAALAAQPDPAVVLALGLAVAAGGLGAADRRSRPMALVAALVTAVVTLLALVVVVVAGVRGVVPGRETLLVLVGLAVPGVVAAGLALLCTSGGTAGVTAVDQPPDEDVRALESARAEAELVEPDPGAAEREPVWPVDEAAGAVWTTAGEAATGAPASGWGGARPSSAWPVVEPSAAADPPATPELERWRTPPAS